MKLTTTIAAAAACFALQASAQTGVLGGTELARIDTNGDGAVSREEFDTFAASAFQTLDSNSDRSISAAEAEGQFDAATFSQLDADGDGAVSRQEFGRAMSANFAAADQDGNGLID